MNRLNMVPHLALSDLDALTEALGCFDGMDLLAYLQTEFGRGFLMGLLHTNSVYADMAEEQEAQDDEGAYGWD